MGFSVVLSNVLIMLVYILCGYALVKSGKGKTEHAKTLSAILLYICGPAMIISTFRGMPYSREAFAQIGLFFVLALLAQLLFFLLLFSIFKKRFDRARYRILCIGSVLGNAGFLGLPLVKALFPNDPLAPCFSSAFLAGMNMLVFTVGVYAIKKDKRYISLKAALLNPTVLSVLISLPIYIMELSLPEAVDDTLSLLGKMTTPLCMMVLGMRMAAVHVGRLFRRPFAYAVCGLKLIVFPLLSYLVFSQIPGLSATFRGCMVVLSAVPSAAIVLSLAELHQCEQELSANVVLLTTLLSVLTLPLVTLML